MQDTTQSNDAASAQNTPSEPSSTPAPPINKAHAEILLKADISNIAKKVKAGKTLSPSERNILQSAVDGGKLSAQEYVDNVIELADTLGVTRRTISRWKKIDGSPETRPDGRYHVPSWREFKRQRGHDDEAADDVDPQREKNRQLLLKNEELEAKIAVLKRHWMPVKEVERIGGEVGSAVRRIVAQIHLAAPNVVGVSVAEAEARLKEIEDEVLQALHLIDNAITEFKASIPSEPKPNENESAA